MTHTTNPSMPAIFTRTLIVLLCLCSCTSAYAGTIRGIIKDAKGEKLPFASVFIPGTTTGTAANAAGEYLLTLQPGTYKVSCQLIGYKQLTVPVTITGNETQQLNFTLQNEGLSIKEVVVKTKNEDPAYRIIRKAIARRSDHLKQVRSFQSSIYLKGVFRTVEVPDKIFGQKIDRKDMGTGDTSGKGVIYLCEEIADYYSQQPNKERTIIHSVRESGDANGLGFAQIPSVITFYENNVKVMEAVAPRGLVSPIADNAISFYKYRLEGEFVENDQLIYKIRVTPRRQFEPLFSGIIYIADDDWAIHSLSLATTAKTGIEYLDSLNLTQSFLPMGKDNWVVKSQVFVPRATIFGIGFTGSFVTVYTNQKVNEPVPDSVFSNKLISSYDKTANKKDTSYWTTSRPVPLEEDELKDYRVKDSIAAIPPDNRHDDSLRRRANRKIKVMDVLISGKTFRGKAGRSSFTVNGLLWATNYNSVEGLNIAPNFSYSRKLDTGKRLTIDGALRYGFENRHFNAIAGAAYTYNDPAWRGRNYVLGIEGGKYVFQYNAENPVNPSLNTFSTLLYNQNYLKIYERWQAGAYFKRNYGNGLSWYAKLEYQHRMPLNNESNYSWAKGDRDPMTSNLPAELSGQYWEEHDAALAHIGLSYQPGFAYVQYPDYKAGGKKGSWPLISVSYDKGISGLLNSKVNYDKWRVGIQGEARLKLFGILSYNLAAGGFINDNTVSIPDMMHLYGNEYPLAATYLHGFQIAPYYKFSNTEQLYGEAHVEYNLYGLFTNKIPLFRRLKWYFILGNNTFYADDQKYYTEAFLSIDNIGWKIYRLLRVDFVHSWESKGENRTGIRVGLRLGSLFGKGGGSDGQWRERP